MALAVPQVGGNTTTASNSTNATFGSATTSGSLIVVFGMSFNTSGSGAGSDVTDSKSNTYTLAIANYGGTNAPGVGAYYNQAGTRGASHQITYNGPGGSDSVNMGMIEITGQDSSPYDATTAATANDGTSPFTVTSAAAISGNQIALYCCTVDTGTSQLWTNPTGYSDIVEQGTGASELVSACYYKLNETGTPAPAGSGAWTVDAGGARQLFVTFKEVGAGPSFIAPLPFVISQAVTTASYW